MKLNVFISAILIVLTTSCGGNRVEELTPDATKVTNKFYSYLKERKFDSTKVLFSAQCLADTPPDSISAMLERMNKNRGDVQSATLEQNVYSTNVKSGKTQKEFTQTYKVVYSSGFITKEEFVFLENEKAIDSIYSYIIDFY